MDQPCKHGPFSYEAVTATGAAVSIGIIRCSKCGTAIGAFLPQIPDALNALSEQLGELKKDIQRIKT